MNWKALTLLLVAWSTFAPFAQANACADSSCCVQMQSCCGHCHCTPEQTCQAAPAPSIDSQIVAENLQASPRVELELFTLNFDYVSALNSDRAALARLPESPPPRTALARRARLCLWLI